ncbi:MAG: Gfo/Idh/MocA family oxidoreductase [Acidobacteria bacterium]|nr:Gfo/Idh/MocA family oxidoreductase [Acidobacteriota bacterium]
MIERRVFMGGLMTSLAAASDRVRVAMIGVRGRGAALTGDFLEVPGVEIAALVDVDSRVFGKAASRVEAKTGKRPAQFGDLRRVLEDKTIDAVVIATPDHWHGPAAILAAEAGKDVYVEKPCSHNLREGRLMVEAAARHRRVMQVGTQARSRGSAWKAMEWIHGGRIGKVRMAKAWNVQLRDDIGKHRDAAAPKEVDYDLWMGPAEAMAFRENRFHYSWHWWWNFGTGDMGNDGVHQMDMARWALKVDAPVKVSGWGKKVFFEDDQQTPDSMNITFEYAGGEAMIFEQRIWTPYGMGDQENGVAVYGSEGMVEVGRWGGKWGFKVFDSKGKLVTVEQAANDEKHAANFVECVKTRKRPNASIEIGHTSTLHAHLGNIVAKTGRNLVFDPVREKIERDVEANGLLSRRYRKHWAVPRGV